jgi:hypothetical protein
MPKTFLTTDSIKISVKNLTGIISATNLTEKIYKTKN